MKRKAVYWLVSVFVVPPLVGGIVHAIRPAPPDPPVQKVVHVAQVKVDDNPLAGVRQWYAYLDGNNIACYASQTARWYIVVPTPEQRADGEVMVVNKSPSNDAWNMACSKQPVTGQW